jgi:hypothetical protein
MPTSDELEAAIAEGKMPLATIAIVLALGVAMTAIFGWTLPRGRWSGSVGLLGIMGAATAVGSLLGFLFGLPRFEFVKRDPKTDRVKGVEPVVADTAARDVSDETTQPSYRPSTNLDEIADWLTKIIVGIGLTQLGNVGSALSSVASHVISPCTDCGYAQGFVSALIVYASIGGFLFTYMWTRLHYAAMAAEADLETSRTLKGHDKKTANKFGVGGKGEIPIGLDRVTPSVVAPAPADVAPGEGQEGQTVVSDDPNKGRFGGKPIANGRILRARIEPSEYGKGVYRVTLTVGAFGNAPTLGGSVIFYLHPTFTPSVVTTRVEKGIATLTVLAYGAFTVGAVADDGKTRLELDLADHPEAPEDFRSR